MTENNEKKGGKFTSFLHAVFVHNIGLKIFAILFSVALCLVVMGLKTRPSADAGKTTEEQQPAPESRIERIL